MKIISIEQIEETSREVHCPKGGFVSYRFLLKKDKMGFGFHKTIIPVGPPQFWHYKNHLEACYCESGEGIITNVKTKKRYLIKPGTMYVLDKHDKHIFQAIKEVTLLCVFNPPLKGMETHGKDGSYIGDGK